MNNLKECENNIKEAQDKLDAAMKEFEKVKNEDNATIMPPDVIEYADFFNLRNIYGNINSYIFRRPESTCMKQYDCNCWYSKPTVKMVKTTRAEIIEKIKNNEHVIFRFSDDKFESENNQKNKGLCYAYMYDEDIIYYKYCSKRYREFECSSIKTSYNNWEIAVPIED